MAKTPRILNRLALECLEDRCVPSATGATWSGVAPSKSTDLPNGIQVGHDTKTLTLTGAATANRQADLLRSVRAWAAMNDPQCPGAQSSEPPAGTQGGATDPSTAPPPNIVNYSGPGYTGDTSGGTCDKDDATAGRHGWDQPYYM